MDVVEPKRMVLYVFCVLIFGITVLPNYDVIYGMSSVLGYNFSSSAFVDSKFRMTITPPGVLYMVWTIIFVWQAAFLAYIGTLFRRRSQGGRLYYAPPFILNSVYVGMIIACIFGFLCNIFWKLELIPIAFLMDIGDFVSTGVVLWASTYGLKQYGQQLIDEGHTKDIYLTIILFQNGVASYFFQTLVGLHLYTSATMTFYSDINLNISESITLSIMLVLMTIWFALDITWFDRYTRYIIIPYVINIYFLAGNIAKNCCPDPQIIARYGHAQILISSYIIALLVYAVILMVVKLISVTVLSRRHPWFKWTKVVEFSSEHTGLINEYNNLED